MLAPQAVDVRDAGVVLVVSQLLIDHAKVPYGKGGDVAHERGERVQRKAHAHDARGAGGDPVVAGLLGGPGERDISARRLQS